MFASFIFVRLYGGREVIYCFFKLEKSEDLEKQIAEKGLDLMEYSRSGRYRIRLSKTDMNEQNELLTQIMKQSYKQESK